MRRRLASGALLSVCASWLAAGAGGRAGAQPAPQPPAATPGPLAPAPGPPAPAPPPLVEDDRQRRAIRGRALDADARPQDLLREFELTAFPPPGRGSPWIDDAEPRGRAAGAPGMVARGRRAADPLALRPDLPWLARLEMPDLPVHWDDRIIKYLEFYKEDPRGHAIMAAWLRDQGRYHDMIVGRLRAAGLPEDLIYVCMIESSFDPHDYSRSGASGLWQFMPAGGAIYGLAMNRWVDDRNDPERSTDAAINFWKDLYDRFGDWDLSIAAYNAGYGAVLRGIARYNTNDYWQLIEYESALPWESSIYVPKALAAAIVGHNRRLFGFDAIGVAPAVTFDRVTVPASVPLATIGRAAGADGAAIERLNPQLRRGRTPPGVKEYVVRIPTGTAALFAQRLPQLRGDWDGYDAYLVAYGERFEDVATVHGISRAKLRALNQIDDETEVGGGTVLVVPRVSDDEKRANRERAVASLYRAGEPAGGPDDPLLVAVPDPSFQVAGRKRVFYRVVAGDSQFAIAAAFDVRPGELAGWNGLADDAHLHPRMVLQVWVPPDFDAEEAGVQLLDEARLQVVAAGSVEHVEQAEKRLGRERIKHLVKRGDTLEKIGRRYGLSARDLARINQRAPDDILREGEEIVVYRVVDKTRSERAARQAAQMPRPARPARQAKPAARKPAQPARPQPRGR